MARGEIVINESMCKGCGYCAHFCNRGCITLSKDKFTSLGMALPVFSDADRCNACGICVWMCPDFAIDVYKYAEAKPPVRGK